MSALMTVHDVFAKASCSDHPLMVDAALLEGATTLWAASSCCWRDECNCDETGSIALARLADGRYLTVFESSDYTGHGCQCDGGADLYDSLAEAYNLGLTDDARDHYTGPLP